MNGLHLGSNIYFPGRWNLRIWCSYGVKHHLEQPWINLSNLFFLDAYFAIIDFVDFHPFVCLGKKTPLLVFSLADTGLFISHLVKCSGESRRSGTIGDPDYVAPITVPEHSAGESIILAPFTGKRVTNNPFSLCQLLAEAYNLRQEDLQRQLSEDGELLWHWSKALSFYIYISMTITSHTHKHYLHPFTTPHIIINIVFFHIWISLIHLWNDYFWYNHHVSPFSDQSALFNNSVCKQPSESIMPWSHIHDLMPCHLLHDRDHWKSVLCNQLPCVHVYLSLIYFVVVLVISSCASLLWTARLQCSCIPQYSNLLLHKCHLVPITLIFITMYCNHTTILSLGKKKVTRDVTLWGAKRDADRLLCILSHMQRVVANGAMVLNLLTTAGTCIKRRTKTLKR